MMEKQPTVGDTMPVNLAMHSLDLSIAVNEHAYFLQRRDQSVEKMRFGLVALNGASLVALLGAMGGGGSAAAWLGFTPVNAVISACLFATGVILAGHALNAQALIDMKEAGNAAGRRATLNRLVALCKAPMTDENFVKYGAVLDEQMLLPVTGFQWSPRAIFAQHFAGGAWLIGVMLPLATVLWPMLKAKLGF